MTLVLLILFAVYIIFEAADRNQLYVTVISTLLLNLTCSPTIAPRRLPKVKTPLSSPNSFGREHNVEVTPGSPLITFLVSAFSALCESWGCYLSRSVDCTPAWYNVTKAFVRDTNRFRYYCGSQDTELCLGLECPKRAERATSGSQSGVHPRTKHALSQVLIAILAFW
jgi:hypothetical protein